MRRHERRDPLVAELSDALIGDCEAVLRGRYVERLLLTGLPVPPWAWTNLLAHGRPGDLEAASSGVAAHPSSGAGGFVAARARLARRVLDAAGDDEDALSHLQATVLVPLELAIADEPRCRCWSPQRWEATLTDVVSHLTP